MESDETRAYDVVDPNPDRRRSSGAWYIEDRGVDVIEVLQVRGHGALTLRSEGRTFKGVSLFTTREIQWGELTHE